jgi:ABC-type tungstate transport system substrate-binding protein
MVSRRGLLGRGPPGRRASQIRASPSTVNGVTVTDQVLLLGGIMLQLPLAMALLSRVLPDRASRWANLVAALASVAIVLVPTLVTSTPDPDDLLFAAAELVGLLFIIGSAWTWRPATMTTA